MRTGRIKNPGVGSGKGQGYGETHTSYKDGNGVFQIRLSKQVKEERRYCERCGKDLLSVSRYHWVVHHKDHDRSNNEMENFELLCKRCHQLEHNCYDNFSKGATTISKESSCKRSEAPGPSTEGDDMVCSA